MQRSPKGGIVETTEGPVPIAVVVEFCDQPDDEIEWECLEGLEAFGPYKILTDGEMRELRRELEQCVRARRRAEAQLGSLVLD
jgi:hypothetical protein